ncbi:hypothetical protein JW926_08955 [Candidatus Sumerlaeota bacterium]|nr:hypothetical protein [Candidatus Sumerlaeota bacterium]
MAIGFSHIIFLWKHFRARHLLVKLQRQDPTVVSNRISRDNTKTRENLSKKIVSLGPEILRTVLKFSRWEGVYFRRHAYDIILKLTDDSIDLFTSGLQDPDRDIRWSSVKWLRDKGRGGIKAIPQLAEYIRKHPFEEMDATAAMRKIDPERAAKCLIELILDKTAPVRARLDASIGLDYSLKEEMDVSGLVALLRDAGEDFTLRESIPAVLGSVIPASYGVIPLLVEALDDKDHQTRILSAQSLGLIGESRDEIMIALVRAREDADIDIRRAADDALKKLQE